MANFKICIFVLAVAAASISACPSGSPNEERRLIQVSETKPAEWLSQDEIHLLIIKGINFMDITDRNFPSDTEEPSVPRAFPGAIRFRSTVTPTFQRINTPRMTSFVTQFCSYTNRYYNNRNGVASAEWLYSQVSQSINNSGYRGNATARYFSHSWPQKSVIARIQGSESGLIILGAHQDSINANNPTNGGAPGGDDNASGSVALLETLRVYLESGIIPKKSIEFQWYAAEEVGLRGSGDIAQSYYNQRLNVLAMLNFDVVGYYTGVNKVSFLTDYVDASLNTFLRMLVDEYLTYGWINKRCGYACSDHASWNRYRFPAASPAEAEFFPSMHTTRDTTSQVNYNQVREFVKLALGYVVELAEPVL